MAASTPSQVPYNDSTYIIRHNFYIDVSLRLPRIYTFVFAILLCFFVNNKGGMMELAKKKKE
jgi:hypothetical protein